MQPSDRAGAHLMMDVIRLADREALCALQCEEHLARPHANPRLGGSPPVRRCRRSCAVDVLGNQNREPLAVRLRRPRAYPASSRRSGKILTAASVINSVSAYVGTSKMKIWLIRRSVRRPVLEAVTARISSSVWRLPFINSSPWPARINSTALAAAASQSSRGSRDGNHQDGTRSPGATVT